MPAPASLWLDTLPAGELERRRPALAGPAEVDVAIVGGGYTGLWTAYYLARRDPGLRIVVLEREFAGFGASGRNGGWLSNLLPLSWDTIAAETSREGAVAWQRAANATVDEVLAVARGEGIDAQATKGGFLCVATSELQAERLRESVEEARAWGFGEDDLRWLSRAEARRVVAADGVLGATFTPHCAAVHPARLVRGLARAVERLGVTVHEQTPVTGIEPGVVTTPTGRVRAAVVVRATEGFTAQLPGLRRALAPVYSLMVATEPLAPDVWDRIGLRARETFADNRHLVIYGQRTSDDRLAFGGRGAPYHFGSRIRPEQDRDPAVFAALHRVLVDLLPVVQGAAFTHAWGGPLGIARDWCASVGLDRGTGMAWAGGYVGDGVSTTNLAGRTLADLVLERDTDLVRLPWVNHRSPQWEPEPLRWLGVSASLAVMTGADAEEERTGRQSRRAALLSRVLGH